MTTIDLEERLDQIARRVRATAHKTAAQWYDDAQDIEQEMLLAICERAASDPDFLRQTDSYIVKHAAWRAVDGLRRGARRNHAGESLDDVDDELVSLQAYSTWEQVEMAAAIRQAAAGVGDKAEQVVAGMLDGQSLPMAAEAAGVPYRTAKFWIDGPVADALSFLVEA